MVYLHRKNILVFHTKSNRLYFYERISEQEGNLKEIVSSCLDMEDFEMPEHSIVRKSVNERDVFLLEKDNNILVLVGADFKGFQTRVDITAMFGHKIASYRPFDLDKVVTLCEEFTLFVHQYDQSSSNVMHILSLPTRDISPAAELKTHVFEICDREHFLAVSSHDASTGARERVFYLELNKSTRKPVLRDVLDFRALKDCEEQSLIFDINLDFYSGKSPIVILFELGHRRRVQSYHMLNGRFHNNNVENKYGLFGSVCLATVSFSDQIWAVSMDGVVYTLQVNQVDPGPISEAESESLAAASKRNKALESSIRALDLTQKQSQNIEDYFGNGGVGGAPGAGLSAHVIDSRFKVKTKGYKVDPHSGSGGVSSLGAKLTPTMSSGAALRTSKPSYQQEVNSIEGYSHLLEESKKAESESSSNFRDLVIGNQCEEPPVHAANMSRNLGARRMGGEQGMSSIVEAKTTSTFESKIYPPLGPDSTIKVYEQSVGWRDDTREILMPIKTFTNHQIGTSKAARPLWERQSSLMKSTSQVPINSFQKSQSKHTSHTNTSHKKQSRKQSRNQSKGSSANNSILNTYSHQEPTRDYQTHKSSSKNPKLIYSTQKSRTYASKPKGITMHSVSAKKAIDLTGGAAQNSSCHNETSQDLEEGGYHTYNHSSKKNRNRSKSRSYLTKKSSSAIDSKLNKSSSMFDSSKLYNPLQDSPRYNTHQINYLKEQETKRILNELSLQQGSGVEERDIFDGNNNRILKDKSFESKRAEFSFNIVPRKRRTKKRSRTRGGAKSKNERNSAQKGGDGELNMRSSLMSHRMKEAIDERRAYDGSFSGLRSGPTRQDERFNQSESHQVQKGSIHNMVVLCEDSNEVQQSENPLNLCQSPAKSSISRRSRQPKILEDTTNRATNINNSANKKNNFVIERSPSIEYSAKSRKTSYSEPPTEPVVAENQISEVSREFYQGLIASLKSNLRIKTPFELCKQIFEKIDFGSFLLIFFVGVNIVPVDENYGFVNCVGKRNCLASYKFQNEEKSTITHKEIFISKQNTKK